MFCRAARRRSAPFAVLRVVPGVSVAVFRFEPRLELSPTLNEALPWSEMSSARRGVPDTALMKLELVTMNFSCVGTPVWIRSLGGPSWSMLTPSYFTPGDCSDRAKTLAAPLLFLLLTSRLIMSRGAVSACAGHSKLQLMGPQRLMLLLIVCLSFSCVFSLLCPSQQCPVIRTYLWTNKKINIKLFATNTNVCSFRDTQMV